MTGTRPEDATQAAVADIRARVLCGRGLGARPDEQAGAQRRRDLLGALPAPLERELVAMTSDLIRHTSRGPVLDQLQERFERLCEQWKPANSPSPSVRLRPAWSVDDSVGRQ